MRQVLLMQMSVPVAYLGQLALLSNAAIKFLLRGRFGLRLALEQMAAVGMSSLPIVLITVGCAGMVLSLYAAEELVRHGAPQFVGWLVAFTICREIGPVVTAVSVAATSGSAFAAQLGTMKVTEQIDALRAMATNPIAYLVTPRLLACIVMLPVLCVFADITGTVGGYIVAAPAGVHHTMYLESIHDFVEISDVLIGLIKTIPFGAIIAIVSCNQGLRTTGGAMGVGRATTQAVVLSFVLIYAADFILSAILPK